MNRWTCSTNLVASLLRFQVERVALIWDEIYYLGQKHWAETEGYQIYPFNPDKDRYISYNESGFYRQYTARTENGEIAGHAGIYITVSMHTQISIAQEDTWYLLPEHRKGRNALNLLKFVENDLRQMGVMELMMSAKLSNKSGRIMELSGYEHIGNQYLKRLHNVRSLAASGA